MLMVIVKDDDGDEKKKPASKYHKAGTILQLPTPPKMMYDYPLWRDWMKEVDTMLNNQQEALYLTISTSREAICADQLSVTADAHKLAETALNDASTLVESWLRLEGERRLLEALQLREREKLRAVVLSERAEAFRRASATPVAERLAAKRAERELAIVTAAEKEAERVEKIQVQTREYTDGTAHMVFIDGREGERVQQLAKQKSAQEYALTNLSAFLGEIADDRIF